MLDLAHHHALGFESMVAALEASGEPTRLRILALLHEGELTVSELMAILGQSQPRVSRHLKLLVEAGLITRHREGAWAFFRFADAGAALVIRAGVVGMLQLADPVLAADRRRLEAVRSERAAQAAEYFARHAQDWDRIRALHVSEARVEAAVQQGLAGAECDSILDVGTGTGRMLQVLGEQATRAVGIDVSPAMLGVARANLERAGLRHIQLRQGDAYAIPSDLERFDVVILHQVLHYLDDPGRAVREAARALKPGGRLVIVDFAPHEEEGLREGHAHRRLGFAREEVEVYLSEAGLVPALAQTIAPAPGDGATLAVSLWIGRDARIEGDFPFKSNSFFQNPQREVA